MDEHYHVGQVLTGKVTGIQSYGAFVEMKSHTQGLIHISEISDRYVRDIRDFVKLGEEIQVKILSIDSETGKLSLSLKGVYANRKPLPAYKHTMRVPRPSSQGFVILQKKLDEWIRQAVI
ncbi:MAG: S1 RNA-binding domain-containing protein [Bacillales bacterium]|nr:S1 RNA-binding domain-containing protein [Bacillales bacterium]